MSSSSSASNTSQSTRDGRVAGDNGAIGVSNENGDVMIQLVPDEAFALGLETIRAMQELATNTLTQSGQSVDTVADTVANALTETQQAQRSETTQILSDVVRVGVPVAALAYVAARVLK